MNIKKGDYAYYIKMDNLGINYRNILLVGEDSYE